MELLWALFTTLGFLIFAVAETVGLVSKRQGDTYSENIRRWLRRSRYGMAGFVVLWTVFSVWFLGHIPGWWG